MAKLEDLIHEANDTGFYINNLFQLDNGTWQANLRTIKRDNGPGFHFAYGKGPRTALRKALQSASLERHDQQKRKPKRQGRVRL